MTNFWEIFRILLKIFNDTESKKEDGNMKETQNVNKLMTRQICQKTRKLDSVEQLIRCLAIT